jgi:hypothetical protein
VENIDLSFLNPVTNERVGSGELGARVVDALVFEVAVVLEDQVIISKFVLRARGIDARLPARIRKHDDERVFVGMLKRSAENERERCHRALGAAAEADDLKALDVVVLERAGHLVEEIREVGREVVRQVGETEALEGLGRCAADFGVVYETLKL